MFVNEGSECHFNKSGFLNLNMGNCITSKAKTRQLAEELDCRIKQGSIDDVKALLRRGAPVNGIPERVGMARA